MSLNFFPDNYMVKVCEHGKEEYLKFAYDGLIKELKILHRLEREEYEQPIFETSSMNVIEFKICRTNLEYIKTLFNSEHQKENNIKIEAYSRCLETNEIKGFKFCKKGKNLLQTEDRKDQILVKETLYFKKEGQTTKTKCVMQLALKINNLLFNYLVKDVIVLHTENRKSCGCLILKMLKSSNFPPHWINKNTKPKQELKWHTIIGLEHFKEKQKSEESPQETTHKRKKRRIGNQERKDATTASYVESPAKDSLPPFTDSPALFIEKNLHLLPTGENRQQKRSTSFSIQAIISSSPD